MRTPGSSWDYLIVTASNDAQAAAYQGQLRVRRELGLLAGVRQVLVVPDPAGRRIGSGGSTLLCIAEVLRREGVELGAGTDPGEWLRVLRVLRERRVLIVHAGGDSRRLPAYGPCGKIFIPVPGESDSAVGSTLFDRQLPLYLDLPEHEHAHQDSDVHAASGANGSATTTARRGQVVITAGDVLLTFDPAEVRFAAEGVTGLGAHADPKQASKHGVYCAGAGGRVRLYLQKPSPAEQKARGAVDRYGQSILDIGVVSFDAATAVALLQVCGFGASGSRHAGSFGPGSSTPSQPNTPPLLWSGEIGQAIDSVGLDFYREILCALGRSATAGHHADTARASGSRWPAPLLRRLFDALSPTPFSVGVLPHCGFLHFGTTRQIIHSGIDLLRQDRGVSQGDSLLSINNDLSDAARVAGADAWVEGCRVDAPLTLEGENVLVGADVTEPLKLPRGACLDVLSGRSRRGQSVHFVRCHGVADSFKDSVQQGGTFCGMPFGAWLQRVGAKPEDIWGSDVPADRRTLWDARVFPSVAEPEAFVRWLWMFGQAPPTPAERQAWLSADRYSSAEIATLADQDAFHARRAAIRASEVRRSLRRLFRLNSGFSAADLARVLGQAGVAPAVLAEAYGHGADGHAPEDGSTDGTPADGTGAFALSRILHSLGSALQDLAGRDPAAAEVTLRDLRDHLPAPERAWLDDLRLTPHPSDNAGTWAGRAQGAAFEHLSRTILHSGATPSVPPRHRLRVDEIVWGRAPARLDLGGGWTDTPPYSLEHGGTVINAAVNLNGQPPIHCYGRVIDEPVLRITSIDLGTRIEIRELADLLDYNRVGGEFSLAKAALALTAFSEEAAAWRKGATLADMLRHFGGGIELTTLAAVPKGSGLGTSSIVGAVILSVVQRVLGRRLTQRELFHGVLRLEQALTSGGGWQDQVGGAVDGVKVITTGPGLLPDARIHYVPADVLDPRRNGGCTLLYYTGITRVAKNILRQVVGRYLDRDRQAMATLRELRLLPPRVADAMARKDLAAFGQWIDVAWRLNKQLDPNSSTDEIESMLDRARPHLYGAKLLGAGGGGFLLMVCKSRRDANAIRRALESDPPNDRARFFRFGISRTGLAVNVC